MRHGGLNIHCRCSFGWKTDLRRASDAWRCARFRGLYHLPTNLVGKLFAVARQDPAGGVPDDRLRANTEGGRRPSSDRGLPILLRSDLLQHPLLEERVDLGRRQAEPPGDYLSGVLPEQRSGKFGWIGKAFGVDERGLD